MNSMQTVTSSTCIVSSLVRTNQYRTIINKQASIKFNGTKKEENLTYCLFASISLLKSILGSQSRTNAGTCLSSPNRDDQILGVILRVNYLNGGP